MILLLNYLVKQKVINGIHDILGNLDAITNGNLDTEVSVTGNHEFEELSKSINTMVRSIVNLSNRISAIIEISGIPLVAFEFERGIHLSESPEGYLGIITDVTEDILQKKQLCYENSHDPLTGLYKFDFFKEICIETLEKLQPGNHFLSARRSGDEFCMLIFDCADRAEITDHLNNFYKTLGQNTVALSDTQTKIISASCGFVLTTDAKTSITELLSRADEALYKVKRSTKGRYIEYTG